MITHYLSKKLLETVLRGSQTSSPIPAFTPPGITYVGLLSLPPTRDGLQNDSEIINSDYKRQAIEFSDAINGEISNARRVNFGFSLSNWGEISYFGVFDKQIGGNLLFFDQLDKSYTITAGLYVSFSIGSLKITLL